MHRLGCVADLQRRHGEAEQLFMVVAKEPRNSEAMGDLGYCYFLQGKLPQAEQVLRQAVALQPESARHHNNLGLVLGHLVRRGGSHRRVSTRRQRSRRLVQHGVCVCFAR